MPSTSWLLTRTHVLSCGVLALSFSLTIGCGNPADTPVKPKDLGKATTGPEAKPGKEPAGEVTLRTVDLDGYNAEIEKLKGNVVLVDFWATWCGPCVEQFPHTVELHEKYSGQGLAVVSMSFDGEEEESAARDFLSEKGATFLNLRSEYGAGVESAEKFNLSGSVPHYRLYDRAGKLHPQSWDGKPEGIEKVIEELLKAE